MTLDPLECRYVEEAWNVKEIPHFTTVNKHSRHSMHVQGWRASGCSMERKQRCSGDPVRSSLHTDDLQFVSGKASEESTCSPYQRFGLQFFCLMMFLLQSTHTPRWG